MVEQKTSYRRMVLALAAKYQFDRNHALSVERTALKLFDSFKEMHGLGLDERTLLSHAALLHDIGSYISKKKHNKHTRYIIESDEKLDAYSVELRPLLSLIAANHRKKIQKETYLLPKKQRDIVLKLSAILRIADSLNYLGEEVVIKGVSVQTPEVKISMEGVLPERLSERLARKKDLFMEVFKLDVTLCT